MSKKIVKLADITPDPHNANKGTQRGRSMLERSLRNLGAGRSILVDKNGLAIAGNKTLDVAAELNLQVQEIETDGNTLIVVKRMDLDLLKDSKAKELAIADNRTSEIGLEWDGAALSEFQAQGIDLAPWFTAPELAKIGAGSSDGAQDGPDPQFDKAEALREQYGVELGQVWELGEHRLMCGDSTKDLSMLMGLNKSVLVVTSPPYNQKLDQFKPSGMHTETRWVKNVQSGSYADSKPEGQYQSEQIAAIQCWQTYMTADASIFYNHKNRYRDKEVISPYRWIDSSGAKVRQEIIWKREGSVTQNARMFLPCDERIFWLYFGADFYFDDTTEIKTFSSVWEINSHKDRDESSHGCAFPIEIPFRCIRACSKPSDVVLEPYCGSGTTLIACEQLGRRCYAMEISPAYVAVAIQRWVDLTGKEPKLCPRPDAPKNRQR